VLDSQPSFGKEEQPNNEPLKIAQNIRQIDVDFKQVPQRLNQDGVFKKSTDVRPVFVEEIEDYSLS
jgi:hypothetical protein